jgi:CheY-like chemotaxis protein
LNSTNLNSTNPKLLLAVDDSEDDLMLLRMALKQTGLDVKLLTLPGGEQAIDYLGGTGKYADRNLHPLPRLMILDLKMPRKNGFDVLTYLQILKLKPPFVAVMSTSAMDSDQLRCKELGADIFHTKPGQLDDLSQLLEKLVMFFQLPSSPPQTG